MIRTANAVVLAGLLAAAGCAAHRNVHFDNPSTFVRADAQTAEQVARRVLRELRFDIVVPAKRDGLIETHPLTGASWFEFWRKDTVGREQVAEASLHTVRRRATVSVSPKDEGSEILVRVVKERKSAPGATPSRSGEAFSVFHVEDTELMRQDALADTARWVSKGRDLQLEQHILGRIHDALK